MHHISNYCTSEIILFVNQNAVLLINIHDVIIIIHNADDQLFWDHRITYKCMKHTERVVEDKHTKRKIHKICTRCVRET